LGEPLEQIDLALISPVVHHALDLVGDGDGVPAHVLTAQGGVVQHLGAALGAGVEHDALAEHRGHEGVRGCLVERLVGRAEERLVGRRAGGEADVAVGDLEHAELATFLTDPPEQADRVLAQLVHVAELALAAGDPAGLGQGREIRGGVGVGHLYSSSLGASGWTSSSGIWAPRGVDTSVATPRARSAGLHMRGWRPGPGLAPALVVASAVASSYSVPASRMARPGRRSRC